MEADTLAEEWDGTDLHEIVQHYRHIVTDPSELKQLGLPENVVLPKTSVTKKKFWLSVGYTTPFLQIFRVLSRLLLLQRIKAMDSELGPVMEEILSEGEDHFDIMVWGALNAVGVFNFNTPDMNGHKNTHTWTLSTEETNTDAYTALSTVDDGYRAIRNTIMRCCPDRWLDVLRKLGITDKDVIDHTLEVLRRSRTDKETDKETHTH